MIEDAWSQASDVSNGSASPHRGSLRTRRVRSPKKCGRSGPSAARAIAAALLASLAVDACAVEDDGACPGDDPCVPANRPRRYHDLMISPARATLLSTDGAMPTQAFTVTGVGPDGRRVAVADATWSLSDDRFGSIRSGTFASNGGVGGTLRVLAREPNGTATATAQLTVRVERHVAPGADVPADAAARFGGASVTDAARAARILYPLDQALVPGNLPAPDVQWDPVGSAGDVFRLRLAKTNFAATAYVANTAAGFRHDIVVDPAAWASALASDPGEPLAIAVDRLDHATGDVVAGAPVQVRSTRGVVSGTIYYWDVSAGRIQRLNTEASFALERFMPNPPPAPPDLPSQPRCAACHVLSRDGRSLATAMRNASAEQYSTAIFDLTRHDLRDDPAPTQAIVRGVVPTTFSPDGTRLFVQPPRWDAGAVMSVVDARTGAAVPTTNLPSGGAIFPEWSPDGRAVALVTNVATESGNAIHAVRGDLALLPVLGDPAATPLVFGALQILHRADAIAALGPRGNVDAHPTWSPDSQLVVFQHGEAAFSNIDGDVPSYPAEALWAVAATGGDAVRLDRADGGSAENDSYWPTFSPTTVTEPDDGTYAWVAFSTWRAYGNALAGNVAAAGATARTRQIWVTAVRLAPPLSSDPSAVPFWLPGQERNQENSAAFWAMAPPN